MTETGADQLNLEPYLGIWAETVASVLGQIAAPQFCGQKLTVDWQETPATDASVAAEAPAVLSTPNSTVSIFLNTTLAGTLRGEQAFGVPLPLARWLAQTFVGEPTSEPVPAPEPAAEAASAAPAEIPAELSSNHRDALEELFRQIAGVTVSALKPKWGEVQIHVQAGSVPAWPSAATAWIRSAQGVQPALAIEVRLSAALAAALRTAEATAAASVTQVSAPAVPSISLQNVARSVNLELLKNVPLDLTLRFGQRRMLLREILELGPGSVIELDRRLKDPVDLLLDGRVLARGEVVVIQGHYGLRVTEIAKAAGAEQ